MDDTRSHPPRPGPTRQGEHDVPADAHAPGLERRLLRRLPWALLLSALLPGLAIAALLHWGRQGGPALDDKQLWLWVYTLIGTGMLLWSLLLTVALGCWVVVVMKGPAYRADSAPPPESPGLEA